MNRISIVLPVYNAQETILATLNSVANQSFDDFELLIINDGSTDNSDYLIQEFISGNPNLRIKYFNKENGGVSSARNIGMQNSEGEFVAFIDSDDVWLPQKLELQVNSFETEPAIMLLGSTLNGKTYHSKREIIDISFSKLLFKCYFHTPTTMLRRDVIEKIGYFNSSRHYSEDYEYWLRIVKKHKCCLMNKSLIIAGDNKPLFGHSGLSSNLWLMEKNELLNYKDLYTNRDINFFMYCIVSSFSFLKYIRRCIIVYFR